MHTSQYTCSMQSALLGSFSTFVIFNSPSVWPEPEANSFEAAAENISCFEEYKTKTWSINCCTVQEYKTSTNSSKVDAQEVNETFRKSRALFTLKDSSPHAMSWEINLQWQSAGVWQVTEAVTLLIMLFPFKLGSCWCWRSSVQVSTSSQKGTLKDRQISWVHVIKAVRWVEESHQWAHPPPPGLLAMNYFYAHLPFAVCSGPKHGTWQEKKWAWDYGLYRHTTRQAMKNINKWLFSMFRWRGLLLFFFFFQQIRASTKCLFSPRRA